MSYDDFTKAARAEAESRWPTYAAVGFSGAEDRQVAFRWGAEWARSYLAEQEPTDAERAVRELHAPREEQVLGGDCSIEACDHEDECPTVPFLVCTECWRVADESDTYFGERGVGHVAYPCPTIQALDAARRDEEKR